MLNDLKVLDLSTDFGLMCGQLLAAGIPEHAPWFGIDNERVLRDVLRYDPEHVRALVEGGVMQ